MIEVKNLTKKFGGLIAINNVTMKIKDITLLIGPNGSGKSTLVNVITGIYKPDSGRIYFNGMDITDLKPYERYKLGIIRTFQIPQPLRKMTVLENVLFVYPNPGESFLKAIRKSSWMSFEEKLVEKAFDILKFLKLDNVWDFEAYKLSGGQLKLLEIARALMCDAKVILMDEPISGVLPKLARDIFEMIKKIKKKFNISFLIIEHRLDIAINHVDYVYALFNGKIISEGTPNEIINDNRIIEAYLGEKNA